MFNQFLRISLIGLFLGLSNFGYSQQVLNRQALLILNMPNEPILPRNFRTTNDSFKHHVQPTPSRQGLDLLKSSGSAQFSEKSLQTIIHQLGNPKSLYIVDLRQESHGFLNGIAVSWYAAKNWGNEGLSLSEVEKEEKDLLQNALKQGHVTLHRIISKDRTGINLPSTNTISLTVTRANTEQQVVTEHQIAYIRIPVTDHIRPSDESVDRFIVFIRSLPKERWIHFHCAAGVGRTTTFMCMYDMMLNAKQTSFEDIIQRQWALGGLNLSRPSDYGSWKHPYGAERFQFLKDFYEYCQTNKDNFQQNWSSYLLRNQKAA